MNEFNTTNNITNDINNTNYILIDIRNSDEVLNTHYDSSKMTNFYNIPMNMIRFNKETILQHLKYVNTIYIVCNSGNRSKFIKDKYFSNENKIVASKALSFNQFKKPETYNITTELNDTITVHITGQFKFNLYNMTRLVQLIMGTIMIITANALYNGCSSNKWALWVLILVGCNAVYSSITSNCFMAMLLKDTMN